MRARSLGPALLAACLCSALLARPVAAQSVNRDLITRLNVQFHYVALPLTLFVMVILVYAVVRFRANDDPQPTTEDPALEITWTVATGIILLFVGVSAYSVLASPYVSPGQQATGDVVAEGNDAEGVPDDAVVVRAVGYQWNWEFAHSDANVTTRNELVLPADRDVYIVLSSRDVIHSLSIPALGVKQDAFPERRTVIRTNANEIGEYVGMCTEYCGAGHAEMRVNVTVVDGDEYDDWLDEHEDADGLVTDTPSVDGTDGEE